VRKVAVIDASLAAMWAMPELLSRQALSLVDRWIKDDVLLVAPCLILAEITNAFYRRVVRREIDTIAITLP
jgi:predicted nucleic acid-binding protein